MLTSHDRRLAARDTVLPGLAVLLDTSAVSELLEFHAGRSLEGLERLYVRYKPGMNFLAGYGRNGTIEYYAKTFREDDRVKLDNAREKSVMDEHGERRIVVEDAAIVLSPFPADAKLKPLTRMFSDRGRRHLARLTRVRRRNLELRHLRYKPERRFVGQILDRHEPVAAVKTKKDSSMVVGLLRAYRPCFYAGLTVRRSTLSFSMVRSRQTRSSRSAARWRSYIACRRMDSRPGAALVWLSRLTARWLDSRC